MKFKKLIPFLCLGFIFTSCGGGETPSENISSEETQSMSSEEIISSPALASIEEAIANTHYYGFKVNGVNTVYYTEIYKEDFYYNAFSGAGYIALEEDPNYLYYFDVIRGFDEEHTDYYYHEMDVRGKNARREDLVQFESRTIMGIINTFVETIEFKEDNIYRSTDLTFIRAVADFMQQKGLRYCNALELSVNAEGRLEHLQMFEEFPQDRAMIIDVLFDDVDYKTTEMYTRWDSKGRNVNPRIADYKFLIGDETGSYSIYENETVSFSGIVSAIDVDGNAYVAREEKRTGNVGIRVELKNHHEFNINDTVNVTGVVKSQDYLTHIENATLEVTGSVNYAPIFDEERIVDSNGGGTYAYNYFASSPYYNDSIYSTYAYLSEAPTSVSDTGDTYIDVICPTFGNEFLMQVILPQNLDATVKASIFEALTTNGNFFYDEFPNEICLEKFVIRFTPEAKYAIKLIATNDSQAYKKLTPQEKIQKHVGLENFPVPESESYTSFRFGEGTTYFLEDSYFITSENPVSGVYIGAKDVTEEQFNSFIDEIEKYGAEKYDEIKDYFYARHIIYQIGDTVIDINYSLSATASEEFYLLNMWVYNGEMLKTKSLEENLDEKIGDFFDVDNFLRLSGTYDADYTIFELSTYAGVDFSNDPLLCVALDLDRNTLADYSAGLIELGYKQYRNENNRPYTYKTRGQSHSVFTKDGVFVDLACYHTSDYTYTDHDDYEYRLEILIYKADAPISVPTYDSLDVLSDLYAEIDPSLAYEINLPEGAVVEVWRNLNDWTLVDVDYGYGSRDEAFIYTDDLAVTYSKMQSDIMKAGYKPAVTKFKSILFHKEINGQTYPLLIMLEEEKGYIRIMNDIGGVDFL